MTENTPNPLGSEMWYVATVEETLNSLVEQRQIGCAIWTPLDRSRARV